MAVSIYDKMFLSADQQQKLSELTDEWKRARDAGDTRGMNSSHAAAEDVRKQGYGYSGGADGSSYYKLPQSDTYEAARLPSYRAQAGRVSDVYDAANELKKAQLKAAYDANVGTLEATRAKIPQTYQEQRNAVGAQSEVAKHNFNEYAAASGLNSGTGGQAELSRQNALQGNLAALGRAEADALTDMDAELAKLKTAYHNSIAEAAAKGEYEKAAALLDEYRAEGQSAVSTAKAQADENYRAYSAARSASDAEKAAAKADAAEARSDAAARAATLAKFGDFSGYAALGYGDDDIANMREIWIASNPLLAYSTGTITAEEYERMTGKKTGKSRSSGSGSKSKKPGLTAAQTMDAIKRGVRSKKVTDAYEYWYGEPWNAGSNMVESSIF